MRNGVRERIESELSHAIECGLATEEILAEYPYLEVEDVRQALQYAAALANEEVHPLPIAS